MQWNKYALDVLKSKGILGMKAIDTPLAVNHKMQMDGRELLDDPKMDKRLLVRPFFFHADQITREECYIQYEDQGSIPDLYCKFKVPTELSVVWLPVKLVYCTINSQIFLI